MKRFNYDENDDFQDDNYLDNEYNDDDDDDVVYISQQEYEAMQHHDAIDFMQIELVETDLNQRLLFKAIKMLEKSWFWQFRSEETKLKLISQAYSIMKNLTKKDSDASI
jgi:hypothetical protein